MTLSSDEYADSSDSQLLQQIKSTRWEKLRCVLKSPDGRAMAKKPDVYGNLPLHAAIGYKAPDDVILEILRIHPQATREHGTDYWLPLHVAAMWGTSPEVLEAIIREYPLALDDVGEPGIKGRTPRHFSDRFKHNKELLERPTSEWVRLVGLDY
uniref:Uncharacterized protein n=1 Tax=Odontella aurita TaxID=265563 RepID=A0A7S4HLP8_9STRA|mmetsp:Transcript_12024/g.35144  ORF Transcript_12024/g.35144 Transcript_12024/m.35144 type:complete len:154 (+) Transcript_12024:203-664(+)|eukprot:CAMPEP_0113528708 /NCGR_PEP_ID=MMETSP0015_2-20120614/1991_1 /TAXON_ID=2838 /ORGANISM="Odontella" /LENGTH=153 /DNA_ID=CAMNT_0000427263 /DNA_START=138 /DNA_END=599 /DNA_ORIENTATION=+ /assembly_acc=CAM_ASM_000160